MAQYRKRPVVVEAFRWTGGPDQVDDPIWIVEAIRDGRVRFDDGRLYIRTLEGDMAARPGDFIIKGVEGELSPCKPDIFEATYEPVTD